MHAGWVEMTSSAPISGTAINAHIAADAAHVKICWGVVAAPLPMVP